jgi:hypothetical protein
MDFGIKSGSKLIFYSAWVGWIWKSVHLKAGRAEKSEYLDTMNRWGESSLKESIMRILLYGYTLTIGHIPAVQAIAEPIMAQFARSGAETAKAISRQSRLIGNVLLLPGVICFMIQIGKTASKKIPTGRRFLYILAGIGIPFSIMLLSIIGGNIPPVRSMYALPFALAFMTVFLIMKYKKTLALLLTCAALLVAVYQAETTAQLFYSDYLRYQADVRLAFELDKRISLIQNNDTESLAVAFIGKYEPPFKTNFLPGEVIGHSCFGWVNSSETFESTRRGLAFMQTLGIHYKMPNENQMRQARETAESMHLYPAVDSVRRLQDIIVVKLSDSTYREKE